MSKYLQEYSNGWRPDHICMFTARNGPMREPKELGIETKIYTLYTPAVLAIPL